MSPRGSIASDEILCPKCQSANPAWAPTCVACRRHLHVLCGHCGFQNLRSNERCSQCRTQLHQPWHFRWKGAKARKWVRAAQFALFVVAVALTYKGVVTLANWDEKKQIETPPPVVVLNPDGTWNQR